MSRQEPALPIVPVLPVPARLRNETQLTPEQEDEVWDWWVHDIPDFLKASYPFDVPPDRLPYAREVFSFFGAPRHCPVGACRRARRCRGGDGPPCYRAERKDLQQLLLLFWLYLYWGLTEEELEYLLAVKGNRYARPADAVGRRRPARRGRDPAAAMNAK